MIPVLWLNIDPSAPCRGYWDQGLLELLFDGRLRSTGIVWRHHEIRDTAGVPTDSPEAVVVVAGRYCADHAATVNSVLAAYRAVLVIVSSDEESLFPVEQLTHDRMRLWVMTPRAGRVYPEGTRFLGEGFSPDARPAFAAVTDRHPGADGRPVDVFFAGQITHLRRELARDSLEVLAARTPLTVRTVFTDGFMAGLPNGAYWEHVARAKIVPAPAGPATPDSFRFYEALEAGCVPIADARATGQPEGYWETVYPGVLPFPVLDDWSGGLENTVRSALTGWPANANRTWAWWQRYKRDLACRVVDDLVDLGSDAARTARAGQAITVVVPTSPIPSHPSTSVIDATLDSIRERLPDAEVIVVSDGVRHEQADRVDVYERFRYELLRSLNFDRADMVPVLFDDHVHQANATRAALELVRTPCVLFVEHDTPLVGDVPFDEIAAVVEAGEANVVRLHHEASVLEPHRHLMIDTEPRDVMGVPLLATVQWSQRPHVASTAFYRDVIARYFGRESRTMIEDVMHGVVQQAARDGGWGMFRLFMYAPPGDMKRSSHLDGRGDDPKYDMRVAYDGDRPPWAPGPTVTVPDGQPGVGHDAGRVVGDPAVVVGAASVEELDGRLGVAGRDRDGSGR